MKTGACKRGPFGSIVIEHRRVYDVDGEITHSETARAVLSATDRRTMTRDQKRQVITMQLANRHKGWRHVLDIAYPLAGR